MVYGRFKILATEILATIWFWLRLATFGFVWLRLATTVHSYCTIFGYALFLIKVAKILATFGDALNHICTRREGHLAKLADFGYAEIT